METPDSESDCVAHFWVGVLLGMITALATIMFVAQVY